MDLKRILFVDDEPLVLQGLQRMLRGLRREWTMEFAGSGEKALALMEKEPFDAVISDMRMPGMNGAQLLAEVMRLHPRTIRIILSGHADKDLILQCMGATHQYLTKPCDPDALKAVVRRATHLDYLRQHKRLTALVGQMQHVPTIPALYSAMVKALNDPNASIEEVAALVSRDIGMTARILKLVNSAFFGLGRPIADTAEAVNHLGFDVIKSLALALDTFGQLRVNAAVGVRLDEVFAHSVAVSNCARMIAHAEGADRKSQDEAFVSGLLHDVGKIILLANLPDDMQRAAAFAKERKKLDFECEREIFGADHAAVGGYLLGLWGLPVPVVEAVALHHTPASGTAEAFSPLTAVHAANAVVTGSDLILNLGPDALLDPKFLSGLGLLDRFDNWRASWLESMAAPASS
ncbi:MAG TPA: response regulator [Opitutaceae bacterium]|jgi:HD-like signal output (HDOD) protein